MLFLRIFLLNRVPGLNGDEGMAGIRSFQILKGYIGLDGLVPYTGGLFEYAIALFLALFGNTLIGLRLFPVLMGVLTIVVVYANFRKDHDDSLAFWGAMALGSSPMMVCYNRFAIDNYPFLFSLPILSLILLDKSRERAFLLIPGFFLLGLLVWCHFLGVAVLLPLLFLFPLIQKGGQHVPWRNIAIGSVVALLPIALRVKEILRNWELLIPSGYSVSPLKSILSIPQAIPNLLWIGYRIMDGTFIFYRFTGELALASIPFAPFLALGALLTAGWMKVSLVTRLTFLIYGGILIVIQLLAPYYSIRYLVIPHLILYYMAIRWVCEAVANRGRLRIVALVALAVITGYQILQLGVNYFYTFSRTGGQPVLFPLDLHQRHYENSVHLMENRSLYNRLCEAMGDTASARRLFLDPNLAYAMGFYDPKKRCLDLNSLDQGATPEPGDWLVLYRVTPWRGAQAYLGSLSLMGLAIREVGRLSDRKYRVLEISPL
jgi:hypothetical protein